MSRKISDLPDVPELDGNELFPASKAGNTFKISVLRLLDLIRGGTIRAPIGEAMTELPPAAARANKFVAFDSNGNPSVMVPESGSAADVLTQLADDTADNSGARKVGYNGSNVDEVLGDLAAQGSDLSQRATTLESEVSDLQDRALYGEVIPFETKANMLANLPPNDSTAKVTNDPNDTPENPVNGYYTIYSGTAVYSGLQVPSKAQVDGLSSTVEKNQGEIWSRGDRGRAPYSKPGDTGDKGIDGAGNVVTGPAVISQLYAKVKSAVSTRAPYVSPADTSNGGVLDRGGNIIGGVPALLSLRNGESVSSPIPTSGMFVDGEYDSKSFYASWPHMGGMLRIGVLPNGHNSLFNIRDLAKASGTNPDGALWSIIQTNATDWFPPFQVEALSGGDGSTTRISTGGNHGSDGGSGLLTARMIDWSAEVNGKPLGAGEKIKNYAERITFRWSNEVMAYNTITLGRYVLLQKFALHIVARSLFAACSVMAYEPIRIYREGGPQMVGAGWQTSGLYFDGANHTRQPAANFTNSGTRTQAPNAWACSLFSEENGFMMSWLDRTYGAGANASAYVRSSSPLAYKNANTWKFYHAVIEQPDTGFDFDAGEGYEWAGGYAWADADVVSGTNLDSAFLYERQRKPHLVGAFVGAGSGMIALPAHLSGASIGSGIVGVDGLPVSAADYEIQSNAINI